MSFPAPLTPPDCDLRDFRHMPLDVVRLRDSELATCDRDAAFVAVLLWSASWHQVPAASLPNDDSKLAYLAGFGRDVRHWRAIKKRGALHGFIECSDGRLYHPVVAEKALVATAAKDKQRRKTEAARQALEALRASDRGLVDDLQNASNSSGDDLQNASNSPGDDLQSGYRASGDTPVRSQPVVTPQFNMTVTEDDLQSNGMEGKGREGIVSKNTPPASRARACRDDPEFGKFYERYPRKEAPGHARKAWDKALRDGATPGEIMDGLERYPFNPDRQYVKHPATWLNGECWKQNLQGNGMLLPLTGGQEDASGVACDDPWGIEAWCKAQGCEPTLDPEDRKWGKWLLRGQIVDCWANRVAKDAKLPRTWRGDWSPILEWIAEGWPLSRVSAAITDRARNRTPSLHSIAYFTDVIREWRHAA